ncbi:hypothetical protein Pst134EA_013888 [Puccinia striiformis f. sp. tritici]|uniref:hypothetical protein n=1 Tax=Puccinia striiformis f. sp. tritici TaxID=168172 RepID=UPI002008805B|nr:hypothetical protein Pst134EA_013888 [Puccinia striiformis f. sp. tritici]KAH9454776.1 hypothetical protein Pst134EB_014838 [Puccinia striiformis f. sp. tritici]KAH9466039.1 hypothetical protein Pst134EA_013888 [Puccinia striiformis f. sp. tritici]
MFNPSASSLYLLDSPLSLSLSLCKISSSFFCFALLFWFFSSSLHIFSVSFFFLSLCLSFDVAWSSSVIHEHIYHVIHLFNPVPSINQSLSYMNFFVLHRQPDTNKQIIKQTYIYMTSSNPIYQNISIPYIYSSLSNLCISFFFTFIYSKEK